MTAPLSIIYRGTLTSCQYSCSYCPFALRQDSRAKLQQDAAELERFVDWVAQQKRTLRLFFTPWGEALIRKHYRVALQTLTTFTHVESVAIQTNLHVPLTWLNQIHSDKLSLWCSFHPSQTTVEAFAARCQQLSDYGIAFSVGMVALQEHMDYIPLLKKALPTDTYLWFNAYDRRPKNYYTETQLQTLNLIDPWFDWNVHPRPSKGKPCWAGERSISINGQGDIKRCHFIDTQLGNLYEPNWELALQERACTRGRCECYIGYSQRKDLGFEEAFGAKTLGRVINLSLSKVEP